MRAGQTLLDAILPPLCLGCGEIVASPGALCAQCWPRFSFIAAPHCERCGVPFADDMGQDALCTECLTRPPRFRRARAVLIYDDRSRRVVLPLKHGDRTDMARACGAWMARAGAELLAEADALVPVPLHWRRLWARRFNQSAMLAAAISAESGVPIAAGALKRVKPTVQQVGLSRSERTLNVQGAFRVPAESKAAVAGRRLVLVDDVLTSGATVDGCARALLRAGAANVDVLIFARVADPMRTSI